MAFWVLLGLRVVMRAWFAFRVRQAGERIMMTRAAIRQEGWGIVAIRGVGAVLIVALSVLLSHRHVSLDSPAFALPPWLRWAGFALGLASLGLWTWTHGHWGVSGHRIYSFAPSTTWWLTGLTRECVIRCTQRFWAGWPVSGWSAAPGLPSSS